MRPQAVAWLFRGGLLFFALVLFSFLWFGAGADRSPLGLVIGVVIGGLAGLYWIELQVQGALERALGREDE